MDDGGQGLSKLIVDFDVETNKVAGTVADERVLHARITLGPALQLVKEVRDHLREQSSFPQAPEIWTRECGDLWLAWPLDQVVKLRWVPPKRKT